MGFRSDKTEHELHNHLLHNRAEQKQKEQRQMMTDKTARYWRASVAFRVMTNQYGGARGGDGPTHQ